MERRARLTAFILTETRRNDGHCQRERAIPGTPGTGTRGSSYTQSVLVARTTTAKTASKTSELLTAFTCVYVVWRIGSFNRLGRCTHMVGGAYKKARFSSMGGNVGRTKSWKGHVGQGEGQGPRTTCSHEESGGKVVGKGCSTRGHQLSSHSTHVSRCLPRCLGACRIIRLEETERPTCMRIAPHVVARWTSTAASVGHWYLVLGGALITLLRKCFWKAGAAMQPLIPCTNRRSGMHCLPAANGALPILYPQ